MFENNLLSNAPWNGPSLKLISIARKENVFLKSEPVPALWNDCSGFIFTKAKLDVSKNSTECSADEGHRKLSERIENTFRALVSEHCSYSLKTPKLHIEFCFVKHWHPWGVLARIKTSGFCERIVVLEMSHDCQAEGDTTPTVKEGLPFKAQKWNKRFFLLRLKRVLGFHTFNDESMREYA